MTLTLLTPATEDPVDLAEMKDHLRILHHDEDVRIAGYLKAATAGIERRAGFALLPQTWRLTLDAAPTETITLSPAPLFSVTEIAVKDKSGGETPVTASAYEVAGGLPGRVRAAEPWPAPGVKTGGVRIDFIAGFADAASLPADLKQAVKLLAAHFYEAREAASEEPLSIVPHTVDALLAPYRRIAL
ncbi:MAG: head-tail connector protein [Pseudomonadota bacterium]